MNAEIADPAAGYPFSRRRMEWHTPTVGGDTPLDDYYGSQLNITPNPASRSLEREYYIDLETVQHNATNHMGMGMDCWAVRDDADERGCVSGTGNGNPGQYWLSAQLGSSITPSLLRRGHCLQRQPAPACGQRHAASIDGMGGKTTQRWLTSW